MTRPCAFESVWGGQSGGQLSDQVQWPVYCVVAIIVTVWQAVPASTFVNESTHSTATGGLAVVDP